MRNAITVISIFEGVSLHLKSLKRRTVHFRMTLLNDRRQIRKQKKRLRSARWRSRVL